jgi:hypothetical protein
MVTDDLYGQQTNWLLQAFNDLPGQVGCGLLARYINDHFSVVDAHDLRAYVTRKVVRRKCNARTKKQFNAWAKRQIDRRAEGMMAHWIADIRKRKTGKITVADILQYAHLHGRKRQGTGLFPRYVQNGNFALIDMGKDILKVPACADSDDPALNFLPVLQVLWPFHFRSGQLFKNSFKIEPDGRTPKRISLHRLFLSFQDNDPDNERRTVYACDGDYLNWLPGNLYFADPGPQLTFCSDVIESRSTDLWTQTIDEILGNQGNSSHVIGDIK